jgi:hypothetical protein
MKKYDVLVRENNIQLIATKERMQDNFPYLYEEYKIYSQDEP